MTSRDISLFERGGAVFSPCQKFRYNLWRQWDKTKPRVTYIMLNPSTADASSNDPTVERCKRRAEAMGFGSLDVVNLFALRSTDPAQLYWTEDPIGPSNDAHIRATVFGSDMVICAWGVHGNLNFRGEKVVAMLRDRGFRLHHLGLNRDGTPKHPLYLSYRVAPEEWRAA